MAFDHSHYVPILKGKQGELNALAASASTAGHFTPLLEFPPIPPKYIEGQEEPIPSKSIDAHIEYASGKFVEALGGLPSVFVDGIYVEAEDELTDGSSPIEGVFGQLRKARIPFVPVFGLDRVEDYVESVKAATATDGRGCCLRLLESDLEGMADLAPQIGGMLSYIEIEPENVDLVVDFGAKVPSKAALPYQIDALPLLDKWRSLTVAASSFPVDMSEVPQNSIRELDRNEWVVWLSLRSKQSAVKRMPTYGDYCVNHPVLSEIDPRIINMSPNIRYTGNTAYVIAKGQAIPRKKKKPTTAEEEARKKLLPAEQYPKLAVKIKDHPSWKGAGFSAGDQFVEACANKKCVGNPTDWRFVGTCHHIASVVQQIASLP